MEEEVVLTCDLCEMTADPNCVLCMENWNTETGRHILCEEDDNV